MAGQRKGRPATGRKNSGRGSTPARPAPARAAAPRTARAADAPADPPRPGPFRLGAVAGATPGKWIDTWSERMPRTPLELVPLSAEEQIPAVHAGLVDAAIVRLPADTEGLHVIRLYTEESVVVCARESHLTVADELSAADLVGETLIVPADDVLDVSVPGTVAPRFPRLKTTEDAIATVATGVGITIVPMSLARLHRRKDVEHRPLRDGPTSPVALVWSAEREDPLVDTFIGIVRGRTARSSRG